MHELIELLKSALVALVPRLVLNLLCVTVIVRGIYLRRYPRGDYAFTYTLLNVVTFAVAATLSGVRVEMGLSLGLFAVFGIMRYRTEAMRIRDLTYLFVVIGVSILNGVANNSAALSRVLVIDVVLVTIVAWLELGGGKSREDSVTVVYDRIELLDKNRRQELIDDLSKRLGYPCERVFVQNVNLMHDSAELVVTFRPQG